MAAIVSSGRIVLPAQRNPYHGVWSWLTTVDAKRIGILYGGSAIGFFIIAGIQGVLMRLQLATPGEHLISADVFNQMFTMHGTTMIFLVIMPLGAAFFNYIVPLMIGARDVAFPRLNAWSYWVCLAGGLLHMLQLTGGSIGLGLSTAIFTSAFHATVHGAKLAGSLTSLQAHAVNGILAGTASPHQLAQRFSAAAGTLEHVFDFNGPYQFFECYRRRPQMDRGDSRWKVCFPPSLLELFDL